MMKFIKKIFTFLFFLCAIVVVLGTNNVEASDITSASNKGFEVVGLSKVAEQRTMDKVLKGSKYKYGTISLWSALYKYNNPEEKSMYYFLLSEAKNTSVDYEQDGYRMVNEKMVISHNVRNLGDLSPDTVVVDVYSPKSYDYPDVTHSKTVTIGFTRDSSLKVETSENGMSLGASDGAGIQIGVSFTTTIHKNAINMYVESYSDKVKYNYLFENTTNSSVNSYPPLRGDSIQLQTVVYKMENYSIQKNNFVYFDVVYEGKIKRVKSGKNDYSVVDSIKHSYNSMGIIG